MRSEAGPHHTIRARPILQLAQPCNCDALPMFRIYNKAAFLPGGLLTDPAVTKGEQDANRYLVIGAYGALRNPAGHVEIDYTDTSEAGEANKPPACSYAFWIAWRAACSARVRAAAAGHAP